MSASGKIADTIVFFGWKGVNVVRQWLKPANPQTADQGDRRIIAGGTGRAVGKIEPESDFHQQLIDLELVPGGQTKQSYMVKYIIDNYISNATNYSTELACMKAQGASSDIGTVAEALNIAEFDLDYAAVDPYDKRLGVYLLAKAAIALSFTGSPYTKTLASWTATQWNKLQSDLEV
jgi:hypothetical protein